MNQFFSEDGALMRFLQKTGQIILLNLLWLVCCIPIVTIGSATSALYYALVKSVRRERSYPVKEFFRSFKRTLGQGILFTAVLLLLGIILYKDRELALAVQTKQGLAFAVLYDAFLVVLAGVSVYLFPALSRFSLKTGKLVRLTFLMAMKFLPSTILLLGGFALTVFLILILPMPVIAVLPGVWCYFSSYIMEPVLKKFTPEPGKGEDAWYYE